MKSFYKGSSGILAAVSLLALAVSGCANLDPRAQMQSAIAAESRGDYATAIRIFTELMTAPGSTDNTKAELYNLRCVANDRNNQQDQAIADCNEALRLKPDLARAYNNRAMAYLRTGQVDLTIADLDVATRLNPNDPVAFANRGLAYQRKQDQTHAIADFDESIRIKADNSTTFFERGESYLAQGNVQKAIDDETESIRLDAKNGFAFDIRGSAHAARAELDAAMTDFNAAIGLQPKSGGFYLDRGVISIARQDYDPAIADLVQAQSMLPTNPMPVLWLHIARGLHGVDDAAEIEKNTATLDQTKWPAPIIALYRKQIAPQKLLDLGAQGTGDSYRTLHCVISFNVGEFDLINKDSVHAQPLLQQAIDTCAAYSPERIVAETEVKKAPNKR